MTELDRLARREAIDRALVGAEPPLRVVARGLRGLGGAPVDWLGRVDRPDGAIVVGLLCEPGEDPGALTRLMAARVAVERQLPDWHQLQAELALPAEGRVEGWLVAEAFDEVTRLAAEAYGGGLRLIEARLVEVGDRFHAALRPLDASGPVVSRSRAQPSQAPSRRTRLEAPPAVARAGGPSRFRTGLRARDLPGQDGSGETDVPEVPTG